MDYLYISLNLAFQCVSEISLRKNITMIQYTSDIPQLFPGYLIGCLDYKLLND
jgi:hypothetical protein